MYKGGLAVRRENMTRINTVMLQEVRVMC
jgi:hypothetical protein